MSPREFRLSERLRRGATVLPRIGALLLGSCQTPVGVERTGFEPVFAELSGNALIAGVPSARQQQRSCEGSSSTLGLSTTVPGPARAGARSSSWLPK